MDEPPVFSSPVSMMVVSEAAAVGTDVGSVSAHDPDFINSPVRYNELEFHSASVVKGIFTPPGLVTAQVLV